MAESGAAETAREFVKRLFLPISVLLAAGLANAVWDAAARPEWVIAGSRAVFVVGLVLAWRFGRGRAASALLVLGLAAEAETAGFWRQGSELSLPGLALVALLPLNLALVGLLREWKVVSWRMLACLGVGVVQASALAVLRHPVAVDLGSWLEVPILGLELSRDSPMSPLGTVSFLVAGCVLLAGLAARRLSLDAGFLGALAAAWLALSRTSESAYFLGVGGLVLVLAVVENAFSLAFEDALTGLPGRRAFDEAVAQLGSRYALAMVDIDHFKKVNDRQGHEVGDQVLKMVGRRLAAAAAGGRTFRYGGEEFVLSFAGKATQEVRPVLEEVRRSIERQSFTLRTADRPHRKPPGGRGRGGGKKLKITVSIGVADCSPRRPTPEDVLKAADEALYRAKRAGRNRVSFRR